MLLQVSDVQHNLPGPEDANHYLSSHCLSLSVPGTPGGRVVDEELPVASCPPQRCGDGMVTFTSYPGLDAYAMN